MTAIALTGLAALLYTPQVWAGAGQAGDPAVGKIGGPAVSATVVINPTFGSDNLGETSVRLQKGTLYSASLLFHQEAPPPPDGIGWVLGCDGTLGAKDPTNLGHWTVATLTAARFVNNRVRSWMPDAVMIVLFGQLGVPFDGLNDLPGQRIPVITSVSNAVCSPPPPAGPQGTEYSLSFNAVIQFEDSTK